MTSAEIKLKMRALLPPHRKISQGFWLREIAYQLAIMNEQGPDWICPGCRTRNIAIRSKCRNCHKAKPGRPTLAPDPEIVLERKLLLHTLTTIVDAIDPITDPGPLPLDELVKMGRDAIAKAGVG